VSQQNKHTMYTKYICYKLENLYFHSRLWKIRIHDRWHWWNRKC